MLRHFIKLNFDVDDFIFNVVEITVGLCYPWFWYYRAFHRFVQAKFTYSWPRITRENCIQIDFACSKLLVKLLSFTWNTQNLTKKNWTLKWWIFYKNSNKKLVLIAKPSCIFKNNETEIRLLNPFSVFNFYCCRRSKNQISNKFYNYKYKVHMWCNFCTRVNKNIFASRWRLNNYLIIFC